jgi:hypothetical protein
MKKKKILFGLILGCVFATFWSCSPFVKVYSEEEPGINLYRYHTYNWLDTETIHKGDSGPEWLTKPTQEKIRSAIATQMARYGYKPCDEKPDLMLHYHVVIKNQVMYQPDWTCGSPGEGGSLYGRCNRVKPVNYQEGTLIIDFMDTKTGNQVWRGVAIGILDHIRPEEVDAKIMEAAKSIFKKFPEQPLPHA